MKVKKITIGSGELLWDMLPEGKQLGGAPCNFSYHASQAGCKSFVISAVGNDRSGKEIRSIIRSLGLKDEFIQTDSHPTGTVSVALDEKGHPDYTDFVEYNDNIILRFHPESKELVGFTITDFSLLFAKQDMDLHLPFKVNFEIDKSLFVSE